MPYPIPTQQSHAEIIIKKSRFISYAKSIKTREEGVIWLDDIRQQYPDARHHCWAYLIGNPSCATNAGMGDDGEPSGTAGKPILNVLQHKGVGDIMIIVVRYFGGIKLGAGGLTRAYGQAAQAVMEVLPTKTEVPRTEFSIQCSFALEQQIRYLCSQAEAEIIKVKYTDNVEIFISIPNESIKRLAAQLLAFKYSLKEVLKETLNKI